MEADTAQIDDIVKSLIISYGDLAGSEVLTRALVAERNNKRDTATFWMQVFSRISSGEESSSPFLIHL